MWCTSISTSGHSYVHVQVQLQHSTSAIVIVLTVACMSILIERVPSVTGADVSWHCVGAVLMTPTDSLSTFINVCGMGIHNVVEQIFSRIEVLFEYKVYIHAIDPKYQFRQFIYLFHSLPLSTLWNSCMSLVEYTLHHSDTLQCRWLKSKGMSIGKFQNTAQLANVIIAI